MDTNTGESPGHQSQSQQLRNSPSEEEMGHWTPTGIKPMNYDDDDCSVCDRPNSHMLHSTHKEYKTMSNILIRNGWLIIFSLYASMLFLNSTDEMPNCNDNISDFKCIMETTEVVEVKCAVNYTGNCAPHSIWGYEYGNKSISTVKQEFVCFSETYSGVESTTIITIESGSRLICYIDDSSQDAVQKYQCNTSVV